MNYIDHALYRGFLYGDSRYLAAPISNIVSLFLKVIVDGASYVFPGLEGRCFSYLKGKTYGQCARLAIPYLGLQWCKGTPEARRSFDFEMIKNHPPCFALPAFECYEDDYKMIVAVILFLKENNKPLPNSLSWDLRNEENAIELVKIDQKMISLLDSKLMNKVDFLASLYNNINLFLGMGEGHELLKLKFLENLLSAVPLDKVVDFFKRFHTQDFDIVKKFTGRNPRVVEHLKIPHFKEASEKQKDYFTSLCAEFDENEAFEAITANPNIFPFIKKDFQKAEFIKKAALAPLVFVEFCFSSGVANGPWKILEYVDLTSLGCNGKSFFKDILMDVLSSKDKYTCIDRFVIEMLKKNGKIFLECLEELEKEVVEEIEIKDRLNELLKDLKNDTRKFFHYIEASEEVFSWVNPELKKNIEFVGLCVFQNPNIFKKITINDFSERRVKVKVENNIIKVRGKGDEKYNYRRDTDLQDLMLGYMGSESLQQLERINDQGRLYVIVDSFMQYKLVLRDLIDAIYFEKSEFSKHEGYPSIVKRLLLQVLTWTKNEQEEICKKLIEIDVHIFIAQLSLLVKEKKIKEGDFSWLTETNFLRDKKEFSFGKMESVSMVQFAFKQILEDESFMSENQDRREIYEKIMNSVSKDELDEFLEENPLKEEENLRYLFIGQVHLFKELIIRHLPNEPKYLQFAGPDIFEDRGFLLQIAKNHPEAISRATLGPLGRMVKKAETFFRCEVALRQKSKIMIPIVLRKKIFACMFVHHQDSDLSFSG